MAVYMEKSEFQKSRAFSPAVITQAMSATVVMAQKRTGSRCDDAAGGSVGPARYAGVAERTLESGISRRRRV